MSEESLKFFDGQFRPMKIVHENRTTFEWCVGCAGGREGHYQVGVGVPRNSPCNGVACYTYATFLK